MSKGFRFIRAIIRFLVWLLIDLEVVGRENVPTSGNFVIAANHLGLVDALMPFVIVERNNLVVLVGEKWEKVGHPALAGEAPEFRFRRPLQPGPESHPGGAGSHE